MVIVLILLGPPAWQITDEFMACTVKDSDRLRFAVGDRVQCNARGGWLPGIVTKVPGIVFSVALGLCGLAPMPRAKGGCPGAATRHTCLPMRSEEADLVSWTLLQLWDEGNPYRVRLDQGPSRRPPASPTARPPPTCPSRTVRNLASLEPCVFMPRRDSDGAAFCVWGGQATRCGGRTTSRCTSRPCRL